MNHIWIIRHAPTAWNKMKLLQGRSDIPLSPEGIEEAHHWSLPTAIRRLKCYSSPLKRAVETADILGFSPIVDPLLTEMDWGRYEGERLDFLRMEEPHLLLDNEALGIHFAPPGGESPKRVQDRLKEFFLKHQDVKEDVFIVAHKGVIRALYAWATNWNMVQDPPDKLRWDCMHHFQIFNAGTDVKVVELNVEMTPQVEYAMGEDDF